MTVDTTAIHDPLVDPTTETSPWVPPFDQALNSAREILTQKAGANIHDHDAMIRAAVGLEMRLRQLVAALDKEAGR